MNCLLLHSCKWRTFEGMKTLFLVRHAKSSWTQLHLPDIDRPLNERGYNDAHLVSKTMLHKTKLPDQMISSSAVRAMTTALIFARTFAYPEEKIQIESQLYETTVQDYLHVISRVSDEVQTLMIFAHNFTISEIVPYFLGNTFEEMPTCAILGIDIETDHWSDVRNSHGKQAFYLFPKMLKEA